LTTEIVLKRFAHKRSAEKFAEREGGYVMERPCVLQKPYEVRKVVGGAA